MNSNPDERIFRMSQEPNSRYHISLAVIDRPSGNIESVLEQQQAGLLSIER